jgi:hypothetical protein
LAIKDRPNLRTFPYQTNSLSASHRGTATIPAPKANQVYYNEPTLKDKQKKAIKPRPIQQPYTSQIDSFNQTRPLTAPNPCQAFLDSWSPYVVDKVPAYKKQYKKQQKQNKNKKHTKQLQQLQKEN